MRDVTPLVDAFLEAVDSQEAIVLVSGILSRMPPCHVRQIIVHRVMLAEDPRGAATMLIDELTHHFLPKE